MLRPQANQDSLATQSNDVVEYGRSDIESFLLARG